MRHGKHSTVNRSHVGCEPGSIARTLAIIFHMVYTLAHGRINWNSVWLFYNDFQFGCSSTGPKCELDREQAFGQTHEQKVVGLLCVRGDCVSAVYPLSAHFAHVAIVCVCVFFTKQIMVCFKHLSIMEMFKHIFSTTKVGVMDFSVGRKMPLVSLQLMAAGAGAFPPPFSSARLFTLYTLNHSHHWISVSCTHTYTHNHSPVRQI